MLAVRIAAETGLRISDILKLPAHLPEKLQVKEQKTGKVRKVSISKTTQKLAWQLAADNEHLFMCDRSTIYRNIRKVTSIMGLKHCSIHALRKYYARAYCKAHGLAATQRELNHKYISTTLLYVADLEEMEL